MYLVPLIFTFVLYLMAHLVNILFTKTVLEYVTADINSKT